ncbi:MAG: DNA translocase FtsK [Candidatus Omnitrophica bacterium]|nr:DNA translocase FtsK [Candidatus Omnitrophota bacterium]
MESTRKNEIIAILLFALGVFLFLSLITFNQEDLSFYTSQANPEYQNLTGILGSHIGGILFFTVGWASFVLPLLIIVWSLTILAQYPHKKIYFKFFGTIFLMAAVSSIFGLFNSDTNSAAFQEGGFIGNISSAFLMKYLGTMGALIFISVTILLSLLIATDFLVWPIIINIGKLSAKIAELVRTYLPKILAYIRTFAEKYQKGTVTSTSARSDVDRKLDTMRKHLERSKTLTQGAVRQGSPSRTLPVTGPEIVGNAEQKKQEIEQPQNREVFKRLQRPVVTKPAVLSNKPQSPMAPVVQNAAAPGYTMPTLELLKSAPGGEAKEREDVVKDKAALLERTLLEFDVSAKVVKISIGPVITMFELEPLVGTRVNKITSLSDNISLAMKSSNIRIVAPLPGKGTIGIEIPNDKSELVRLKDIMQSSVYNEEKSQLKLALGKDISGNPVVLDLAGMPHLLMAGTTGSGKTVCINCIISSLLLNQTPSDLKLLMVDPKRVELMMFEGIPHLVSPIVTSPKKVAASLAWLIGEMERRYDVFAAKGVRNITTYKQRKKDDWENMPYIVLIIDELADLMAVSQQDIEGSIMRLAQLSRAAGIHMILATQRPSVDVITGVIKANFPARISFKVASKVDSRTVLDANGAEKLLGRGDMLIMQPGRSDLVRGQCALVEDSEIRSLVNYIKAQGEAQYMQEAVDRQEQKTLGVEQEKDDLYEEAVKIVLQTKQASASMIQRRLRVGYTRAARMIDIMEAENVIGPYNGSKAREILINSVDELKPKENNTAKIKSMTPVPRKDIVNDLAEDPAP